MFGDSINKNVVDFVLEQMSLALFGVNVNQCIPSVERDASRDAQNHSKYCIMINFTSDCCY